MANITYNDGCASVRIFSKSFRLRSTIGGNNNNNNDNKYSIFLARSFPFSYNKLFFD